MMMQIELLSMMTNPTLIYLVLLLGLYGIFFEFVSPGFILPGVVGGIASLTALYALHFLPVNYLGLAFIFLGIALIIAESFVSSFGLLGLGGTVIFVLGSLFLMDSLDERYRISVAVIAAMAVFNIIIFLIGLNLALRSRKRSVQHGTKFLIGTLGKTLGPVALEGQALIRGEIWNVRSQHPLESGASVRVVAVSGLCLDVEEALQQGE
jgi:membrane-bound serine protease (ClpP class)